MSPRPKKPCELDKPIRLLLEEGFTAFRKGFVVCSGDVGPPTRRRCEWRVVGTFAKMPEAEKKLAGMDRRAGRAIFDLASGRVVFIGRDGKTVAATQ